LRPEPVPPEGSGVGRRRWIALVVLCLGQLMIVLDVTVVNVALPSIQRDLHFSAASLAWVINGYLITFAGFLLLAGRLGDLLGRKRVFISGLVLFTAASALCGASQSETMLIAARLLQGVGGALTGSVIVAIITASFPRPPYQAKAMAVFAFTAAAGGSIGLLAGGVLTQALSWHWIFFVNLPIGICAVPLGQLLIEPHEGIGLGDGVDVLGAVLITAALMVGSYAIVEASTRGWSSTVTLGGGGLACALVALFIVRETLVAHPLIPLRIFRSRNVAGSNLARALLIVGIYGAFFLLSIYLQGTLRYSAVGTGLAFLPQTLVVGFFSVGITARLVNRFGAKLTLLPGLLLMTAALAWFARLPAHGSYLVDLLPGFLVMGCGAALTFMPLISLSMSGVPAADFGAASGMSNVSQQIGGSIGLAALATLSATRARNLAASGHSAASALLSGDHLAFTIAATVTLAAFFIGVFVLRTPGPGAQGASVKGSERRAAQPV
jgi:EmrB/QacA subfamily drug resistance transporter